MVFRMKNSLNVFKWFIVCSSFLISFLVDGIQLSFGILLVDLVEYFNADRASIAVIGALVNAVVHITGPLAGFLTEKYGCRPVAILGSVLCFFGFLSSTFVPDFYYLYFTYGIMGGCGLGLMYLPANIIIIQHFTKHRTLATGIVQCGSGVGTFAFNEIFLYSSEAYGWRGCMLLTAGLALHGIACALMFVMPDDKHVHIDCDENKVDIGIQIDTNGGIELEEHIEVNNESIEPDVKSKGTRLLKALQIFFRDLCSLSLFKDHRFVAFIGSTFTLALAFLIPFHLLPDQAIETGMSKSEAAWLASTMGITNAAGRLFMGIIGDRELIKRIVLLKISLFTAGIATATSPLLSTFATKMIYSCVFGLAIGGYVALIPVVLADIFGEDMISKSFGMFMFTVGIGAMFATPIGGVIFDNTGSYDIVFIIAGCEMIVALCILMAPECFLKLKKKSYTF